MPYTLIPPGRRKGNRTWLVRGSVDGREFEIVSGALDRSGAEEFALDFIARFRARLRQGGGDAAAPAVTFAAALDAYIAFANPKLYERPWFQAIRRHFGDRRIDAIVPNDLIEAANLLKPGRSNATKNRLVVNPAARVLNYAAENKWRDRARIKLFKVSRKSVRRPAPDAVMALLLANTTGREWILLAMLYEHGLRLGDLLRVDESQLELPQQRLASPISKTDDRIWLPLSPEVTAAIANLNLQPGERLFPWRSRWQVYRWLVPLRTRLGVEYSPHLSRHALATDLKRRKMSRKDIAAHGAWRDERSLARYEEVIVEPVAGRTAGALNPAPPAGKNPGKRRKAS